MKPSKIFALLLLFATSFGYVIAMPSGDESSGSDQDATQDFTPIAADSAKAWLREFEDAQRAGKADDQDLIQRGSYVADTASGYGLHALAERIRQLVSPPPSNPEPPTESPE